MYSHILKREKDRKEKIRLFPVYYHNNINNKIFLNNNNFCMNYVL